MLQGALRAASPTGVILQGSVDACMELIGKVARSDASQDLPVGVGQPGISGPTPPTSFFEEIDRCHRADCAPWVCIVDPKAEDP
jgi:hypothetical protein